MIKRQDETGALSCRISCCPPSVKRGGYLLPSFHPVPSSGGGPGNSFGEVAFIWRQNILIYLKRKVLTMHWMYIYLSVGDHNEYISIGLDRSQPLFYFVPQDSHSQAGSTILDQSPIIALPWSLTLWLTCLWYLTDVTLVCEDTEFTRPLLANVELKSWICQCCYKDFLKLINVFIKHAICISRP